jgi:hypothetical protein
MSIRFAGHSIISGGTSCQEKEVKRLNAEVLKEETAYASKTISSKRSGGKRNKTCPLCMNREKKYSCLNEKNRKEEVKAQRATGASSTEQH